MIFSISAQFCSHSACSLLVILQGALQKQSFFTWFSIPKITLGLWGDILNCVSHSVHRGVCLNSCWDMTPREQSPQHQASPRTRYPLPQDQAPPMGSDPPSRRPLLQTVRILLECILVKANCYTYNCQFEAKVVRDSKCNILKCIRGNNYLKCNSFTLYFAIRSWYITM